MRTRTHDGKTAFNGWRSVAHTETVRCPTLDEHARSEKQSYCAGRLEADEPSPSTDILMLHAKSFLMSIAAAMGS